MKLQWMLCNRDGSYKEDLINRDGGRVKLTLNDAREAEVQVSSEERAAKKVHPGRTRIKVRANFRDADILVMNGLIASPIANYRTTTFPLVDQSFRLKNQSPCRIYDKDDTTNESVDDLQLTDSEYMWYLIRRGDRHTRWLNENDEFFDGDPAPEIGIVEGDFSDDGTTRTWDPFVVDTTWDLLLDHSRRKDAPDFDLRPLDRFDDVHAALDTHYPRMGTERSDIFFQLGNTISDINWEPSVVEPGLCNRFILVGEGKGASAPVYVAENKGSIKTLGLYQRIESAPSEMPLEMYERKAKGYVERHAWPSHHFELVLPAEAGGHSRGWARNGVGDLEPIHTQGQFGIPPVALFEYGLGDIVNVLAEDVFNFRVVDEEPGPKELYSVRIVSIELNEVDRDGTVVTALECQLHEDFGGATGYEGRIAVDPNP